MVRCCELLNPHPAQNIFIVSSLYCHRSTVQESVVNAHSPLEIHGISSRYLISVSHIGISAVSPDCGIIARHLGAQTLLLGFVCWDNGFTPPLGVYTPPGWQARGVALRLAESMILLLPSWRGYAMMKHRIARGALPQPRVVEFRLAPLQS